MEQLLSNSETAPDWDRIREIADRHGLTVIEDSCDCLGATLHGTPTGTRSGVSGSSMAARTASATAPVPRTSTRWRPRSASSW